MDHMKRTYLHVVENIVLHEKGVLGKALVLSESGVDGSL